MAGRADASTTETRSAHQPFPREVFEIIWKISARSRLPAPSQAAIRFAGSCACLGDSPFRRVRLSGPHVNGTNPIRVGHRESFRPFAPSVLEESVADWFEEDDAVPFMMQVFQIREEKRPMIPAVTHLDGSGRLQTVSRATNPRYHRLIEGFRDHSVVPMVLTRRSTRTNRWSVRHKRRSIASCERRWTPRPSAMRSSPGTVERPAKLMSVTGE